MFFQLKKRKLLFLWVVLFFIGLFFTTNEYFESTSYGILPRLILGEDDRVPVSVEELEKFPNKAITFLEVTFPNGRKIYGSGAMISKDTVVTAGHVVFHSSSGGWAKSIKVYAGYDGKNATHYAQSTKVLSLENWTNLKDNSGYDIAAIKLDRDLGKETGWLNSADASLHESVTVTGFPGEKQKTMWSHTSNITDIQKNVLLYAADTTEGNSGSPVYNNKNELLAVHSGAITINNVTNNRGTILNDVVKKMMSFWITGNAEIALDKVSLSETSLSLVKNQTANVTVSYFPENATIKAGKWTTSNESIATVDYKGKITAKNQGKAQILFTSDDNEKTVFCEVNVTDNNYVPLESIQVSSDPNQLEVVQKGEIVGSSNLKFIPENASNKNVYYYSSDPSILDMSEEGVFTKYKTAGVVDIYVKSLDNNQSYKVKTIEIDAHGDTVEYATELFENIPIRGSFKSWQSVDYFKFIPSETGQYTFSRTTIKGDPYDRYNNMIMRISNEASQRLVSSYKNSIEYTLEKGVPYYIVILRDGQIWGGNFSYVFDYDIKVGRTQVS